VFLEGNEAYAIWDACFWDAADMAITVSQYYSVFLPFETEAQAFYYYIADLMLEHCAS